MRRLDRGPGVSVRGDGAMQIGLEPDTMLLVVSSVFISDVNTRGLLAPHVSWIRCVWTLTWFYESFQFGLSLEEFCVSRELEMKAFEHFAS